MVKTYKGVTIDRNVSGYYVAFVPDPTDTVYYSSVRVMADTLAGIKGSIRDVLAHGASAVGYR